MARDILPSRNGSDADAADIVSLRHPDWVDMEMEWRWLLDSYEGGRRYRDAVYGLDRKGYPIRNLIRHRRETPDPIEAPSIPGVIGGPYANLYVNEGSERIAMLAGLGHYPGQIGADPAATALDDDYELRRARTPVPGWVGEACEIHVSKLYDQEIKREGPDDLLIWWQDCDGRGTPIDDYMRETIAPLLLTEGCLDVLLDRPEIPEGERVRTRADVIRLDLDRCIASYILPQNMVWWRLDRAGRYIECLVREYADPSLWVMNDERGKPKSRERLDDDYMRLRHWTPEGWTLYCADGSEVLDSGEYPYGLPPIVRLVHKPKHRQPHIGQSQYQDVAGYQREYYNRDSELILSDTLQAHPFLSGPEDYCKADATYPVGPGNILPMKRDSEHGTYQGFVFVSPPKDPAESLRKNKQDLMDAKDRAACLAKPAGAVAGSTTAQSGVSKQLDAVTGHKLLSGLSRSLSRAERQMAEYAVMVLRSGPITPADRQSIKVTYPSKFELFNASELLDGMTKLQLVMSQAGDAPETEEVIIQQAVRQLLPGLNDEQYDALDAEIELMMEGKARLKEQMAEMRSIGYTSAAESLEGGGSDEAGAGAEPVGQSGATSLSPGFVPS